MEVIIKRGPQSVKLRDLEIGELFIFADQGGNRVMRVFFKDFETLYAGRERITSVGATLEHDWGSTSAGTVARYVGTDTERLVTRLRVADTITYEEVN